MPNSAKWWLEHTDGRRIGWLWPEDLEAILEIHYGKRKWVNGFAEDFGLSRSTVDRWREGKVPIPKHVAQIVTMMASLKSRDIPMSPIEAAWLPSEPTKINSQ